MRRISRTTFRFYDVTPVGRLMNRMTSDLGTIDGNISQQIQEVAWLSITWISSIVIIASVTPIFLAFSLALTAFFVHVFRRFLPTSQSLRRLEVRTSDPKDFCLADPFTDGLIEPAICEHRCAARWPHNRYVYRSLSFARPGKIECASGEGRG